MMWMMQQESCYPRPGMGLCGGRGYVELMEKCTNQHGCRGSEDADPHKLNCNIVIQYMCQDDVDDATG